MFLWLMRAKGALLLAHSPLGIVGGQAHDQVATGELNCGWNASNARFQARFTIASLRQQALRMPISRVAFSIRHHFKAPRFLYPARSHGKRMRACAQPTRHK